MEFKHIPILKEEIIKNLEIKADGTYVDCTVGGAGHSATICENLNENATLICFDKDPEALKVSEERLKKFNLKKFFIHSDFHSYKTELEKLGIYKVDGVLIDLGVSSYQLDNKERGFSYLGENKLDMRMDTTSALNAEFVVNNYSEQNLTNILYKFGEEPFTKNIVRNIIEYRKLKPINTTKELADIINSSVPSKVRIDKSSLKRVFQAIRIEVNHELDNLDKTLTDIINSLNKSGRLCVLTFHSLEDRIVKNVFKQESANCVCPPKTPICICGHKAKIKIINKKPIEASKAEIDLNSRSKSAKLRIVEAL